MNRLLQWFRILLSGYQGLDSDYALIRKNLDKLISNHKTLLDIQTALQNNLEKENTLMSKITDWAAQEEADLSAISASLDTVVAGIAALDQMIADFQNSPGSLSAADQAALDSIQSASKALVTKSAAISVAPPAPPAA